MYEISNVKKKPPPKIGNGNLKKANVREKCIAFIVLGIEHPASVSFIMQVIQPIDFIEPEFHSNKFIYVSWGDSIIIDIVGPCCGHWVISKNNHFVHSSHQLYTGYIYAFTQTFAQKAQHPVIKYVTKKMFFFCAKRILRWTFELYIVTIRIITFTLSS